MFKKIIHITIALLLYVKAAGFTVSNHLCEYRLVSVSMNSSSSFCNDENSRDCCYDLTAHFQVKDKDKLNKDHITVEKYIIL